MPDRDTSGVHRSDRLNVPRAGAGSVVSITCPGTCPAPSTDELGEVTDTKFAVDPGQVTRRRCAGSGLQLLELVPEIARETGCAVLLVEQHIELALQTATRFHH